MFIYYLSTLKLLWPRAYPAGFAEKVYDLHCEHGPKFRRSLRQKLPVCTELTDEDLFAAMPLGDVWSDARLLDVFMYLHQHRRLSIPDSWREVMDEFKKEVEARALWLL